MKNNFQKRNRNIIFNKEYYDSIINHFGYDPLKFEKINFSLKNLTKNDIQRSWLCHHDANQFAKGINAGEKSIVTTGFGLSGVPHIGTISQILKSIKLQKVKIPVQIVLGDLDAYNGKLIPLKKSLELAKKYKEYILRLGFKPKKKSVLRSQYDELDVLRTSYLIGNFMEKNMFDDSEEDLHHFYHKMGKVDSQMSYRRKLSLNLMTADFISLNLKNKYKNVLVMLGIDEHKYIRFSKEVIKRMKKSNQFDNFNLNLSAIYSPMIKGFNNYPKMSKSFLRSGISLEMSSDKIRKQVIYGKDNYKFPEDSVVYQMMSSVSFYTPEEIKEKYILCLEGGINWINSKKEYAEELVKICSKWKK